MPCSGRGRCNIGCQCVCEASPSLIETDENVLTSGDISNSPWRGEGCEKTCPGYDGHNHESICNARGTCQRDGSCMCQPGFRGNACQFTCPKGENGQDCSGKGACGTTAYQGNSYLPSSDIYKNSIVETNAKQFQSAVQSFYDQCRSDNYVEIQGGFSHIADTDVIHAEQNLIKAMEYCEQINKDLLFKEFSSGRCVGLSKQHISTEDPIEYHVPMIIQDIIVDTRTFQEIDKFECQLEDCEIHRNPNDDHSIADIQYIMDGTQFIFEMRYIHGFSSGRVIYNVNNKQVIFSFTWDEKIWSFSVGDELVLEKTGAWTRARFTISQKLIDIFLYPDIQPVLDNTQHTHVAPDFMRNYIHLKQGNINWYYYPISEDTGLPEPLPYFKNATYRCDMDNDCSGIIRWEESKDDGSLFALITASPSYYIESRKDVTEEYYTYEKLSKLYKGRKDITKSCYTIDATQSKFPFTGYTEVYNTPLKTININLAQDPDIFEQTSDVVVPVGAGLWKYCWEKIDMDPESNLHYTSALIKNGAFDQDNGNPACCTDVNDITTCFCTTEKCGITSDPDIICNKLSCYLWAKERDRFGFAWSENENICLVYNKIKSGKDIKLDKWNTDTGRTDFNPCKESPKTIWFT